MSTTTAVAVRASSLHAATLRSIPFRFAGLLTPGVRIGCPVAALHVRSQESGGASNAAAEIWARRLMRRAATLIDRTDDGVHTAVTSN